MSEQQLSRLKISPKRIAIYLLAFIFFLILMHLISVWYQLTHSGGIEYYVLQKFNLDLENTLPAYFSSLLLLGAGVVCISIAYQYKGKHDAGYWAGIAVVFFILSIDESSSFHELLIFPLRERLGTEGFFYYAWIIPGGIFVLVLSLAYLKFLTKLPRRYLLLFVVSGLIYVGGALGMEAISGNYADLHHTYFDLNYMLIVMVEEACEMLGVTLFNVSYGLSH